MNYATPTMNARNTENASTIAERIRQIIARVLNVGVEKVTPEASLMFDFAADSLDIAEMTMELEDEFCVEFGEDAVSLQTVQQVIDFVEANAKRRR